jgi:hypothetical protein
LLPRVSLDFEGTLKGFAVDGSHDRRHSHPGSGRPFVVVLLAGEAIFALYWAVAGRKEVIEVPLSVQPASMTTPR